MIRHIIENCKWGTTPVEKGIQINLMDEQGNQMFHIPFQGEALRDLIRDGINQLPDEMKRELSPLLQSGLVLPGNGDVPDNLRGPQG